MDCDGRHIVTFSQKTLLLHDDYVKYTLCWNLDLNSSFELCVHLVTNQ